MVEKITLELIKNEILIASQEVVFSIETKKSKNNEFKKWITFNFNSHTNNNNPQSFQNISSTKNKEGKRASISGNSILNFNEFIKIFISIIRVNGDFKGKNATKENSLNGKIEENHKSDIDHNLITKNFEEKQLYISIEENDENIFEPNTQNINCDDNQKYSEDHLNKCDLKFSKNSINEIQSKEKAVINKNLSEKKNKKSVKNNSIKAKGNNNLVSKSTNNQESNKDNDEKDNVKKNTQESGKGQLYHNIILN